MDKKPHFRQSAIIFCLLGAAFLAVGVSAVLRNERIRMLEIPLAAAASIYAVVSSIRIEKRTKR